MSDEQDACYKVEDDKDVAQYQGEVRERWGNTDAYRESMECVSRMTKQEMDELKEKGKAFTRKLAEVMDKPVDDAEVQTLVAEHHAGIGFFYDCSPEMYRGLGQMYADDPRFTAYYDKFRPGLAVWLRDAIVVYCDRLAAAS